MPFAVQVLEELLNELVGGHELLERVVAESPGADSSDAALIHDKADEAIEELRKAWGPTADPHWIENLLPRLDGEFNSLLALFRKDQIWGYVRICVSELPSEEGERLRLFLGVARMKKA